MRKVILFYHDGDDGQKVYILNFEDVHEYDRCTACHGKFAFYGKDADLDWLYELLKDKTPIFQEYEENELLSVTGSCITIVVCGRREIPEME